MPIQGNLDYANPANFYTGLPVEEIKALNADASQQYNQNKDDLNSLDLFANNMQVETRNASKKKEYLQGLNDRLQKLAKSGNYQDAQYAVSKEVNDFKKNQELQDIIKSKHSETDYYSKLKNKLDKGEITPDAYKYGIYKTKLDNKNPTTYNPDTYSSEGMFQGHNVLDDKSKEIYDDTYKRISDWKESSTPLQVNGKLFKYDKVKGITYDFVTGKEVKESEVFDALKKEVEHTYAPHLQQERNIENFKKFYNPTTGDLDNPTRNDIPYSDSNLKSLVTGLSETNLKSLESKATRKGASVADKLAYSHAKESYDNVNVNDPNTIAQAYDKFQRDRQITNYVHPAASKAGYLLLDHKLDVNRAEEMALEHKYKMAEKEYKDGSVSAFPSNYSPTQQYTVQDYEKSVDDSKNIGNQISEKAQELDALKKDPINNKVYIQNAEKQLQDLQYKNSIAKYSQFEFVKKLSDKDPSLTKEYLVNNIKDIVNEVKNHPNKYSSILGGLIHQIENTTNSTKASNGNIQSASTSLLSPTGDIDRNTAEELADVINKEKNKDNLLKLAITSTDKNYNQTPAVILNAINNAKEKNKDLTIENQTTRFGIDENSDKAWDREVLDRTKSLVAGTASDWKIGNTSLDEIVSNKGAGGFYFINQQGKESLPDLAKSKIIPEIGHHSGLNTVAVSLYDSDGHPLKIKGDKNSQAVISLTPGDQNGIGQLYQQLGTQLSSSNDGNAQKQGFKMLGYNEFGPALHDIHTDMMNKDEEKPVILPTSMGEFKLKIISGGANGFRVKRQVNGEFEPFYLKDYSKKKTDTFGSKEQFEELLKLNEY